MQMLRAPCRRQAQGRTHSRIRFGRRRAMGQLRTLNTLQRLRRGGKAFR